MAAGLGEERWGAAADRVSHIEHDSQQLRAPRFGARALRGAGRWAWTSRPGRSFVADLGAQVEPIDVHLKAPLRADALQIGKFDLAREVKLRAFYPKVGLTIRYQAGGSVNGVSRTLLAHEAVEQAEPGLMPTVVDHGALEGRDGVWLLEHMVRGAPIDAQGLNVHSDQLVRRLHRVHRHIGIEGRDVSRVMSAKAPRAWETFLRDSSADLGVDTAAWGLDAALGEHVRRLLQRKDQLDVSLGHGDLVASNILVDIDQLTLIDWEYAGSQPIAFDLSKVHLNAADPALAFDVFSRHLVQLSRRRRGCFSLAEQLTLGHVQTLTWHKSRLERAHAAGRLDALRETTQRRVEAIRQLMDMS